MGREMGVSKHTIYAWKAKFGGLDVNEAQRLRQLEDENHRLKKTGGGSESRQGHAESGDLKKRLGLVKLREEVRWLGEKYQASQQRFCELMQIAVVELSLSQHAERCGAARAAG